MLEQLIAADYQSKSKRVYLGRINRAAIDASANYPAANEASTVGQKRTISYAGLVA